MADLMRIFDEHFAPYAMEIGYFVRDWNKLHEALRTMFCILAQGNGPVEIWHAVKHDRTQRDMLCAVAKSVLSPSAAESPDLPGKRICDEITWLVGRINEFGQERDNVVHSPFSFRFGESGEMEFVPNWFHGHQRATGLQKGLKNRKLLEQLKRYRKKAADLSAYAADLNSYITRYFQNSEPLGPLPQKPTW